MADRRPLLVVDGDSIAHRAYHALPTSITGAGDRPVNALLGFANMLLFALESERPRAVLVAWDTLTEPTYRSELFPAYQGGRVFEDEILEQLDRLPGLCEAFGFATAKGAGYEADDFLAAGVRAELADGGSALVLTSDRDSYQLVSDRVTILHPGQPRRAFLRVGPAEVEERYGIRPGQVPDFIALRGDPSDKLPGAAGIGAKTAAELLRRHGSLDRLIELARSPNPRAHGLTPRQAESLRDEMLPRYRHIATMDADAPVTLPADAGLDVEGAARYVEREGMARLAERMRGGEDAG